MAGYGWNWYDSRHGGQHVVNDTANSLDLVSYFIKHSDEQWTLQIQGFLRGDAKPSHKSTVIFYIGNDASELRCSIVNYPHFASPLPLCHGSLLDSYDFAMVGTSKQADGLKVTSTTAPKGAVWQAKELFLDTMKQASRPADSTVPSDTGNLHFIHQTFDGVFELTVYFESDPREPSKHLQPIDDDIQRTHKLFNDRFAAVYNPQPPFSSSEHTRFSQSLVSNLMGGIGYFYGTSKVKIDDVAEVGPYELLGAVPSRPFFPRGFLWDEGFHLQVILDWDLDLAIEIITSWFSLMDDDGWIAREQILGPEARSKVPPEFQVQNPTFANPPTLFIAVEKIIEKLTNPSTYQGAPSAHMQDSLRRDQFIRDIYAKMKLHYNWFRRTQAGDLTNYQHAEKPLTEGYMWRGRTSRHTLTSGLDDYPRAQPPHAEELHVDALSWVGTMAAVLRRLADLLQQDSDTQTFASHQAKVMQSLEAIHWSDRDQAYCDTTIISGNRVSHVCHKGYVSLLPFAAGLLDHDHPQLPAILSLLHSPTELWSAHGIRSLSVSDPLYGTDENYWRGPIWININYMVLEQLLALAQGAGPYAQQARDIYAALRVNVVRTVFESWHETGIAWEQYHPDTGRGQRTQHFTGWTALVVRIMAMPDLGAVGKQPDVVSPGTQVRDHWARSILLMMIVGGMALWVLVFFRRQVLGFVRDRWTQIRGQRW